MTAKVLNNSLNRKKILNFVELGVRSRQTFLLMKVYWLSIWVIHFVKL